MANMTLRNTPASEPEPALPAFPAEDETSDPDGKSRRDAMAVLAKHAAYTAPAVLAMLSLTAKRAAAGSF
jgi:hypothetical protein